MKNKTTVLLILDRSGSMANRHSDLIGGINSLIDEQKKLTDECDFSIISFDDKAEDVFWNIPINFVPAFDIKKDFIPRGSTALFDAMGEGIDRLGEKLSALSEEERPNKVLVIVYTDDKVAHQKEKYSWDFLFMGANQDAVLTASKINIGYGSSLTYNAINTTGFYGGISGAHFYISGIRASGCGFISNETRTLSMTQ